MTSELGKILPLLWRLNGRIIEGELLQSRSCTLELKDFTEKADPERLAERIEYAKEHSLDWVEKFIEGVAWGKRAGNYAICHEDGRVIETGISAEFKKTGFQNGVAWLTRLILENGKYSTKVYCLSAIGETIRDMDPVSFDEEDFDKSGLLRIITETERMRLEGILREGKPIAVASLRGQKFLTLFRPSEGFFWGSRAKELIGYNFFSGKNDTKLQGFEYVLMDREGREIVSIPDESGGLTPEAFSEGLCWVSEGIRGPYFLIDESGKTLHRDYYNTVHPFREGLAVVRKKKDGPEYYIDKSGQIVLGPYESAGSFQGGFAVIENGGSRILIDKRGDYIMGKGLESFAISGGRLFGKVKDGYNLYSPQNGLQLNQKPFLKISGFTRSVAKVIDLNGREYFINRHGTPVDVDERWIE